MASRFGVGVLLGEKTAGRLFRYLDLPSFLDELRDRDLRALPSEGANANQPCVHSRPRLRGWAGLG
jgi:hypothetical protein